MSSVPLSSGSSVSKKTIPETKSSSEDWTELGYVYRRLLLVELSDDALMTLPAFCEGPSTGPILLRVSYGPSMLL